MSDVTSPHEIHRVLAMHTIECTGLGEVTCARCRDLGWMSWSAYREHLALALEPLMREREAKAWDECMKPFRSYGFNNVNPYLVQV